MTNRVAPYKRAETMKTLRAWWHNRYPDGSPRETHIIQLYQSYEDFARVDRYSAEYIDANQFAKCLVVLRVADIGNGTWRLLDEWEPKPYEITRAKVY